MGFMKWNVIIKGDGTFVEQVVERSEGVDCKELLKVSEQMGVRKSEEVTGPDKDEPVTEISGER